MEGSGQFRQGVAQAHTKCVPVSSFQLTRQDTFTIRYPLPADCAGLLLGNTNAASRRSHSELADLEKYLQASDARRSSKSHRRHVDEFLSPLASRLDQEAGDRSQLHLVYGRSHVLSVSC